MRLWGQILREITVDHAPWEMLIMRGLGAGLMGWMLPTIVPYTTQPLPNGIAHAIDLTFLGVPSVYATLRHLAPIALVLYALGVAPLLSLGYIAALLTAVGALGNSQGALGHHLQLLCLVALAQWAVYAADLFRRKSGATRCLLAPVATQRRAVQAAKLMLAAGYVTSGWTKLIASHGQWVRQLPDLSLQLVKTHANVFYNTLESPPAWSAALPRLIAEHPNLARLAFTPGLLLELGAFLALTGRRAALAVGLALLAMHLLVREVMELGFVAHECLLVIFFINVPWLAATTYARWRAGRVG